MWTDDKITILKECVLKGYSASQTAGELGAGFTRNAVIGKVHRLRLTFKKTAKPVARKVPTLAKPAPKPVTAAPVVRPKTPIANFVKAQPQPDHIAVNAEKARAAAAAVARETARGKPVPFMERRSDECVFLLGSGWQSLVCGAPVIAEGKPYCAHHHELTHTRPICTEVKGVSEATVARSKAKRPAEDEDEVLEDAEPVDELSFDEDQELETAGHEAF